MKISILGRYDIELVDFNVCYGCGKVFRKKRRDDKTCESCRMEAKSKIGTTQLCKNCGRKYIQKYMYYKFCSSECKEEYYYDLWKGKNKLVILERDEFQCFYCGKTSYGDKVKLHVDHIYPKSKGGEDTANNLVTTCQECNSAKSSKIFSSIELILSEVSKRNKEKGIDDNLKIKLPYRH